jgi:NADP-dependent 3-hydroxy acid dehydrogenase YdfG
MHRLDKNIVLITGAAKGFDKAIAKLFTQENTTVIFSDIDDALGRSICVQIGGDTEYVNLVRSLNQPGLRLKNT